MVTTDAVEPARVRPTLAPRMSNCLLMKFCVSVGLRPYAREICCFTGDELNGSEMPFPEALSICEMAEMLVETRLNHSRTDMFASSSETGSMNRSRISERGVKSSVG